MVRVVLMIRSTTKMKIGNCFKRNTLWMKREVLHEAGSTRMEKWELKVKVNTDDFLSQVMAWNEKKKACLGFGREVSYSTGELSSQSKGSLFSITLM